MIVRVGAVESPCNRRRARALWLAMGAVGLSLSAQAEVDFQLQNLDPTDVGLNDPTPVEPVGDNTASTLGEQRWKAVEGAADLWAQALDGPIPVVVSVRTQEFSCGVLGSSTSGRYIMDEPGLGDGVYSVALAERLLERELNADDVDIKLEFNRSECPEAGPRWYLGLDGKTDIGEADLLATLAHELAHGLGFESLVNPVDGRILNNAEELDPFSRHLYSLQFEAPWTALDQTQRANAASTPRDNVWLGEHLLQAADDHLSRLALLLEVSRPHAAWTGLLTPSARNPEFSKIEEPLRSIVPRDACGNVNETSVPHILLAAEGACDTATLATVGGAAGARAVIEVADSETVPPYGFSMREVTNGPLDIPVLRVTNRDGMILAERSPETVTLRVQDERRSGADASGRPFLYTPKRPVLGASLSHWDPALVPSPLMSPMQTNGAIDLTLVRAALLDLGWDGAGDDTPTPTPEMPDAGGRAESAGMAASRHSAGAGCSLFMAARPAHGLTKGWLLLLALALRRARGGE